MAGGTGLNYSVQHIEFIHTAHFEHRYFREKPPRALSRFIDFYWETKFDELYAQYPDGFSDALFPNVGYTYLVNLGTPFVMQLGEEKFPVKGDGFLPRHKPMVCHHTTGNRIFGVKFKISPVLLEKKINFSEYREYIFPLAYLMDRGLIEKIKSAPHFQQRVEVVSDYYTQMVHQYGGNMKPVEVVSRIIDDIVKTGRYHRSVEELAADHGISTRTLQRYFEATTSISAKHALQLLRIRKAVDTLVNHPASFHYSDYGYYDYSHFYKHLRQFLSHSTLNGIQPHLKLLKGRGLAI